MFCFTAILQSYGSLFLQEKYKYFSLVVLNQRMDSSPTHHASYVFRGLEYKERRKLKHVITTQ